MENLRTAAALALTAQKHIVLQTADYAVCRASLGAVLQHCFGISDIVEIDLLHEHSFDQLVDRMVLRSPGCQPQLHPVVVWRNLEHVDMSLGTRIGFTTLFDQLERYNTLAARDNQSSPIKLGPYMVQAPQISLIVPILETAGSFPKLSQPIKDRFWFCQSVGPGGALPAPYPPSQLLQARADLASVYVSPEVHEYVCSLLVFTRSHRLCSLAPLSTRPTLRAHSDILLLAKALVVYSESGPGRRFVTPEYVKVAFRKIGYWLVDWETNALFSSHAEALDFQRRSEIAMLTGDWYGSEWEGVRRYLDGHMSLPDAASTTGFSNRIVDDVLEDVAPPL